MAAQKKKKIEFLICFEKSKKKQRKKNGFGAGGAQ